MTIGAGLLVAMTARTPGVDCASITSGSSPRALLRMPAALEIAVGESRPDGAFLPSISPSPLIPARNGPYSPESREPGSEKGDARHFFFRLLRDGAEWRGQHARTQCD